jgi:hypothetical protein
LTTLVKYDPAGLKLLSKELEVNGYSGLAIGNINFNEQGNLIMGGFAHTYNTDDGCVMEVDPDGNILWNRTFHASSGELGIFDIDLDASDNIYICGRIKKNDDDAYYAKLHPDGDVAWEFVYEGPGASLDEFRKVLNHNNYCYFAGVETGISTKWDFLIMKTDLSGEIVWKLTYDGDAHRTDDLDDICFDSESNILVGGFIEVELFHHKGVTIKYSNPLGIDEITNQDALLSVYPNPAGNYLEIQAQALHLQAEYKIIDIQGRIILQDAIKDFSNPRIELQGLNPGIYFLKIYDGHKQYNAKFVKN